MVDYTNFAAKFREIQDGDLTNLPGDMADWITQWDVREAAAKQGSWYLEYQSEQDIASYILHWNRRRNLHYFDAPRDLIDKSHAVSKTVYEQLKRLRPDIKDYSQPLVVDYYNAEDYVFQNPFPDSDRTKVRRVLDFGAGYGRQLNIWGQTVSDLVYCGMDAVENAYVTQNYYYQNSGTAPVHDYIVSPAEFEIADDPGIYHLPTWRYDLLPDDFFDLVICVFVLDELGAKLAAFMLDQFARCIKPGGKIYVRDHNAEQAGGNGLNLDQELERRDFVIEFRPNLMDRSEILGLPRIFRKVDHGWPTIQERDRIYVEGLIKAGAPEG